MKHFLILCAFLFSCSLFGKDLDQLELCKLPMQCILMENGIEKCKGGDPLVECAHNKNFPRSRLQPLNAFDYTMYSSYAGIAILSIHALSSIFMGPVPPVLIAPIAIAAAAAA